MLGRIFVGTALFITAGCASIPPDKWLADSDARYVELDATPFYPQSRFQCGPAALTTALASSGADVSLDSITDKVYLPGRSGSLAVELLSATRTSGRIPYLIDGDLTSLAAELAAGRPVVVLQNLGVSAIPRWHFAVVVGIDPTNESIVLRSGTERRRVTPMSVFLRTWQRSDYWGMVVLRPGELPVDADATRFFRAVAAFERTGAVNAAEKAWQSARRQWPGNVTGLFGYANNRLIASDYPSAQRGYESLLDRAPGMVVARNNLALALAHQQQFSAALAEIERASTETMDNALRIELEDTRATILAMQAGADASQE